MNGYKILPISVLLLFFLRSSFLPVWGQDKGIVLKGKVISEKGEAVAYSSVYIKRSGKGTVCNENGAFSLRVNNWGDTLVAGAIGFNSAELVLNNENTADTIQLVLREQILTTREVEINAGENPAIRVIKNAQESRQKNNRQAETYQCRVYAKSVQRLGEAPKRVAGTKIDLNQMDLWVDDKSKIIYMSESLSEFFAGQKGKTKERMIASKVSGNDRAFSGNRAAGSLLNLYEPTSFIASADRPFISPIAKDAFAHYRYELLGTFYDQGKMINKIKVKPRFKADATYSGYINIVEDSWKIHSFQLSLGKDAQMEFIDSLTLEQLFIPVSGEVFMPAQSSLEFRFSILGFKGSGIMVHSYSDYVLNPAFEEGFFDGMVSEILEGSNTKDSSYWEKIRPVPLTYEEKRDYIKRDSVVTIRTSPHYLDSMDRLANRIKWNALITGQTFRKSKQKQSLSITAPLESFSFNAVNGFVAGIGLNITRERKKFGSSSISADYRYGFGNRTSYAWLGFEKRWSGFSRNALILEAGRRTFQFNESNPIPNAFNASLALFNGIHLMKISEIDFVSAEIKSNPLPGLRVKARGRLEQRRIPRNYVFESPLLRNKPEFSPNLIMTEPRELRFSENTMTGGALKVLYTPFNPYSMYPDRRVDLESDWPELTAEFDFRRVKFPEDPTGSNLLRLEIGLNKSGNIPRLGFYDLAFTAGKQIAGTPMSPSDLKHFNGNRIVLCSFGTKDFFLLDYYSYSTAAPYAEGHVRFNFQGLILNRIPGLRKAMLNEMIGVNLLTVENKSPWTEYYFGLERLNFSIAYAFTPSGQSGLRLGVKL